MQFSDQNMPGLEAPYSQEYALLSTSQQEIIINLTVRDSAATKAGKIFLTRRHSQ